jgi:hypothetical protein
MAGLASTAVAGRLPLATTTIGAAAAAAGSAVGVKRAGGADGGGGAGSAGGVTHASHPPYYTSPVKRPRPDADNPAFPRPGGRMEVDGPNTPGTALDDGAGDDAYVADRAAQGPRRSLT